jgi:hypothetical protein
MTDPYLVTNPRGIAYRIRLDLNDYTMFNRDELLKFLVDHQGMEIDIEVPEGSCLTSVGLYKILDLFKFPIVTIRSNNIVEQLPSTRYRLNKHIQSFQYFDVPNNINYSCFHQWTGKNMFGALYNRPTWPRIGIAGHLLAKHADKTSLNFRYNPHDQDQCGFFEMSKLFSIDSESVKNFMNVYDQLPCQLEDTDGYTTGATTEEHTNQLSKFYPDFLIDIVSETCVEGRSFYPTEKTVRSMLMKKPFIIMGPKCFLIHLRQMGFKTFGDYWDEDYDGYGVGNRYKKILTLIDSLAGKSHTELQNMYNHMQPILDHNYKLLLEKKFTTQITYVE